MNFIDVLFGFILGVFTSLVVIILSNPYILLPKRLRDKINYKKEQQKGTDGEKK